MTEQDIEKIFIDKYQKDIKRMADEFLFDTKEITAHIRICREFERLIKRFILEYYN